MTDAPETGDVPEKKSDKKLFIIMFVVCVLLIGGGLLTAPDKEWNEEKQYEGAQETLEEANIEKSAQPTENAEQEASTSVTPQTSADFDLATAKRERILGDRSAPIKISEHSSFTCGHCGAFHKNVFKAFKSAYIDTGKAYLVFSDFPLNAPALHATKIGRCVSDAQYFDYVQALFEKQDEWAYEKDYLDHLKNIAAQFGVDENLYEACLQSEELQEAIVNRMKAVQSQFEVNSTPSFVINNQKTIVGSKSFEEFDQAIQNALAEIETNVQEGSNSEE